MNLELFRTLFEYDQALTGRLWESIMTLSDEQFSQELPYSHGSIRNQMVHMASTQRSWLRGLQADPNARSLRLEPAEYATREQARALSRDASAEVLSYLRGLSDSDLERTVEGMPGPMWQALLHLANHGTDHRAQVLTALADLGAPTFAQDLAHYLWL
jgi:uncharacterized damage-inducible protein DinB